MVRVNSLDPRAPNLNPNALRAAGGQILEADGTAAGVYSLDVTIPAYALIVDIIVYAEAVWDAGTSATLKVGITGDDDDTFFTAVNLKATDLTADQAISFAAAGGVGGTSLGTATHYLDVMDAADRTVNFTVTTVGTVGTAGKTYVAVLYAVPEMDVATFTAS
jgi:hypothetical protein